MCGLRNMSALGAAVAIIIAVIPSRLTAQALAAAVPKVHGCLRVDSVKTTEAMRAAAAKGTPAEDVDEVMKEAQGCTTYTIVFQSSVNIVSHGPGAGTSKISGTGSITFGLNADPSEPEWDLTSGPNDLTAPVYWSGAEITQGKCIVRLIPLPFTQFDFTLRVKSGAEPKVSMFVSPAGDEAHVTMTKCPMITGGYTKETPGRAPIFSPAWIWLHSNAAKGPMAASTDMESMRKMASQPQKPIPGQGIDMEKMMAMAEKMKSNPQSTENSAELLKAMKGVVPDADKQIEEVRNNFVFKMPGDCVAAGALLTRCTINRTVTVPDGKGATQTIAEATVITIAKTSP